MNAESKRALEAFAEPIRHHAREWAAMVFASIVRDIEDRVSFDLAADISEVNALDELDGSQMAFELDVPDGAREWAASAWCVAFLHELERLGSEHGAASRGRGDAFVRQHLRDLEACR